MPLFSDSVETTALNDLDFEEKLQRELPASLLAVLPKFQPHKGQVDYLIDVIKSLTKSGDDGIVWVCEVSVDDIGKMDRDTTLSYLKHIEPSYDWDLISDIHKLRERLKNLLFKYYRGSTDDE